MEAYLQFLTCTLLLLLMIHCILSSWFNIYLSNIPESDRKAELFSMILVVIINAAIIIGLTIQAATWLRYFNSLIATATLLILTVGLMLDDVRFIENYLRDF